MKKASRSLTVALAQFPSGRDCSQIIGAPLLRRPAAAVISRGRDKIDALGDTLSTGSRSSLRSLQRGRQLKTPSSQGLGGIFNGCGGSIPALLAGPEMQGSERRALCVAAVGVTYGISWVIPTTADANPAGSAMRSIASRRMVQLVPTERPSRRRAPRGSLSANDRVVGLRSASRRRMGALLAPGVKSPFASITPIRPSTCGLATRSRRLFGILVIAALSPAGPCACGDAPLCAAAWLPAPPATADAARPMLDGKAPVALAVKRFHLVGPVRGNPVVRRLAVQ